MKPTSHCRARQPLSGSQWFTTLLHTLAIVALCGIGGVSAQTAAPAKTPPSSGQSTPAGTAAPAAAPRFPGLVKAPNGKMVAPEFARILSRGELVVATLGVDTPPFFHMKNDELVGTDVAMAKDIGKSLGVPVRFDRSAKTFNEVVDIVARGEADLGVSKLSRTLARAQVIQFSTPYLTLNHALIVNRIEFAKIARDKPLPFVIRQFTGTIGVIAKSSFADFAVKNFPAAKIVSYPSWPEVLQAVKSGEVVAAYRDEFEIKRLLKSDPAAALLLRTVTFKDLHDTLGIAVGVGDVVLHAYVNQYLSQLVQLQTVDSVLAALDR